MLTVTGVLLALPGCLAVLAGLAGMHRIRRLRRTGVTTWAQTLETVPPVPAEPGSPREVLIRYTLTDGRVFERPALAAKRNTPLIPGHKVLVWYDPWDPDDVLVYGRWGRSADWAFVTAGTLLALCGAWLALRP